MSTQTTSNNSSEFPGSEIIRIVAGAAPLMPGDSQKEYLDGVTAMVDELGADTRLRVYLAVKIFDCLWWIRNYERTKNYALMAEMSDILVGSYASSQDKATVMRMLSEQQWDSPVIKKSLKQLGLEYETLITKAMRRCASEITRLDQLIALRLKTLESFRTSYEAVFNRAGIAERIRLQNEILKRDLTAINVPSVSKIECTEED